MSIKPILFNTKMVEAILDNRKTQTRRLIKEIPLYEPYFEVYDGVPMACNPNGEWHPAQRFSNIQPGNILYVRETFCIGRIEYGEEPDGRNVPYIEQCIGDDKFIPKEWALRNDIGIEDVVWKPAIHMPRKYARIFLQVKGIRAERLQNITEEQAEQEGCSSGCIRITYGPWGIDDDPDEWSAIDEFKEVWDDTIKPANLSKYSWEANPWVWVIEFERINAKWTPDYQGVIIQEEYDDRS